MTRVAENPTRSSPVSSSDVGKEFCRVVVLRSFGEEVLMMRKQAQLVLPAVPVIRHQRLADQLNQQVRMQLGIQAYCLFSISFPKSDNEHTICEVMEFRSKSAPLHDQCVWVDKKDLKADLFMKEETQLLAAALSELHLYKSGSTEGPFGKPGWLQDLCLWIEQKIEALGLRLTGDIRQLNASPRFALLRLETNGPAVWFKAVGERNLNEFSVSLALSQLLPSFVPMLLATLPSVHGWLSMECEGPTLDQASDFHSWECAAETLAQLQVESRGWLGRFLAAGCRELRIDELLKQVDPFMDVMKVLMGKQEKRDPLPLAASEIDALTACIKETASAWEQLEIPDTLGNLDVNPENIVRASHGCIFLDWAEAYIGPPFLTFELLCAHSRRRCWRDSVGSLAEVYGKTWGAILPAYVIHEGQHLANVLAPFAYAVGSDLWREPVQRIDRTAARYLRSITRRMYRECQMLKERRTICLN